MSASKDCYALSGENEQDSAFDIVGYQETMGVTDMLPPVATGKMSKRRTGRPLSYTGDPNCPSLSPEERRKIKRRISNRESARRIRDKQQWQMETLLSEVSRLQSQQQTMKANAQGLVQEKRDLEAEVAFMQQAATSAQQENEQLKMEVRSLRDFNEVGHFSTERMAALEQTLKSQEQALQHSSPFEQALMENVENAGSSPGSGSWPSPQVSPLTPSMDATHLKSQGCHLQSFFSLGHDFDNPSTFVDNLLEIGD